MAMNGDIIPNFYQKMIAYFEKHPEEQFYADPNRNGANKLRSFPDLDDILPYEPCLENYMTEYLNQKSVQHAIHVINKTWPGTQLHSVKNITNGMEPIWQWIIDNDPSLHITIVSVDDDTVCGTLGRQSWIWEMGWTVDPKNNWKVWTDTKPTKLVDI